MKVAIVHDYLREFGGAERVVEALHEIFPSAPIFVAYYNPSLLGPHSKRIKNWEIKSSFLQKLPFANKLVSPFRIFAPLIFESFDLSEFDVVISSSSCYFSQAVITKPPTLHLCYMHTPPRYLYGYTTSFNYKKHLITRLLGELANHFLRIYDFEISQRPDILIANSKNIKDRIKKFYRRDSQVIYPPIDLERFKKIKKEDGKYFLSLGRLVRGKGTEIIVQSCTKLNLPLKVVGSGPELINLKKIAGKTIDFLGAVDDEKVPELFANALATIVASEDEDFGIVPVESMAAGTPVIAVNAGGFRETIINGKTGEFYEKATVEDLMEVLKKFDSKKYSPADCHSQAEKFSKQEFQKKIKELIEKNQS